VAWWMMGLNDSAEPFFIFILIELILTCLGYSLGLVLTLIIYDPGLVQRIQPLILLPLMVFAGFFVNSNSIPVWLSWLQAISPLKYAFRATMNIVLSGQTLYCQTGDLRPIPFLPQFLNTSIDPMISVLNATSSALICPITQGEQELSLLGMSGYSYWIDIIILAGMMLFLFILGFLLLVFRKPLF